MTVQELIDELSMSPRHLPVKVLLSEVYGGNDNMGNFCDEMVTTLSPDDAIEADRVRNQGSHVLILSK